MSSSSAKARRLFWMKQFRQWHWISAAICLVGTLLFAVTGVTLNHADLIGAEPEITNAEAKLPPELLPTLSSAAENAPVPARVAEWISKELDVNVAGRSVEWSE